MSDGINRRGEQEAPSTNTQKANGKSAGRRR